MTDLSFPILLIQSQLYPYSCYLRKQLKVTHTSPPTQTPSSAPRASFIDHKGGTAGLRACCFVLAAGHQECKDIEILKEQNLVPFRQAFNGPIIAAGGYLRDTAEAELTQGTADLITFGECTGDCRSNKKDSPVL